MTEPLHQSLADGRWHKMTLAEQLGNVGSEYERALRWKQKGNAKYFDGAFARMLELLALEIRTMLGLMGVTSLAELNPSWVRPAQPVSSAGIMSGYPYFEENLRR